MDIQINAQNQEKGNVSLLVFRKTEKKMSFKIFMLFLNYHILKEPLKKNEGPEHKGGSQFIEGGGWNP